MKWFLLVLYFGGSGSPNPLIHQIEMSSYKHCAVVHDVSHATNRFGDGNSWKLYCVSNNGDLVDAPNCNNNYKKYTGEIYQEDEPEGCKP